MVQKIAAHNKELMQALRRNFSEARREADAFITLWKYLQAKERTAKFTDDTSN
jgi:hypothetical protein